MSTDHSDTIRSVLDSIPYTAPEVMPAKVQLLLEGVVGLLRSLGFEVRAVEAIPADPAPPSEPATSRMERFTHWLEIRRAPLFMLDGARVADSPEGFVRAAGEREDWPCLRQIAVLTGGRWNHLSVTASRRGDAAGFVESLLSSEEWADLCRELEADQS